MWRFTISSKATKKNGAAGKAFGSGGQRIGGGERADGAGTRRELGKALTEQAFGVAGLVSTDAAAEIGQLTGVKVLVAGQVVRSAVG